MPLAVTSSNWAGTSGKRPSRGSTPGNPPPPPTHVDFNQRVQSVISTHNANIDFVNGLAHPRHWDYIDYDQYRHPMLYNPLNQAMTFRYFYAGDYRELYLAASANVVLNVAGSGVFPCTAVGDDYLTSGSFSSGTPPIAQLEENVGAASIALSPEALARLDAVGSRPHAHGAEPTQR
jgi:hypothetical protein